MLHRNGTTNGIWTNEVVYKNLSSGKSEDFLVERVSSLQEGFDSDSQRGFPVRIDDLTTLFTFEQRIVRAVPFSQSTAVAAPFTCMVGINNVQADIVVEASLLKNLPELIKRNAHNSFVEPSSLGFGSFKLLDGNVGTKPICDFDDFPDDLTEIGLDKISFFVLQYFQLLDGIQGLKPGFPFHQFLSLSPDMLSKIGLIEDSAFWRNHANSEVFGIHIDSHDVFSLRNFLVLRKISDNLWASSQTECLACPSVFNQAPESLIVSVLFDWNSNPVSRIYSKLNEEIGFCAESLAVSRYVELDCQSINIVGFLSPHLPFDIANYLRIKRGVLFDN